MAGVVDIISRCGLSIDAHRRNQPNKSKLVLYEALIHSCTYLTRQNTSVIKLCVGDVHILM